MPDFEIDATPEDLQIQKDDLRRLGVRLVGTIPDARAHPNAVAKFSHVAGTDGGDPLVVFFDQHRPLNAQRGAFAAAWTVLRGEGESVDHWGVELTEASDGSVIGHSVVYVEYE